MKGIREAVGYADHSAAVPASLMPFSLRPRSVSGEGGGGAFRAADERKRARICRDSRVRILLQVAAGCCMGGEAAAGRVRAAPVSAAGRRLAWHPVASAAGA